MAARSVAVAAAVECVWTVFLRATVNKLTHRGPLRVPPHIVTALSGLPRGNDARRCCCCCCCCCYASANYPSPAARPAQRALRWRRTAFRRNASCYSEEYRERPLTAGWGLTVVCAVAVWIRIHRRRHWCPPPLSRDRLTSLSTLGNLWPLSPPHPTEGRRERKRGREEEREGGRAGARERAREAGGGRETEGEREG